MLKRYTLFLLLFTALAFDGFGQGFQVTPGTIAIDALTTSTGSTAPTNWTVQGTGTGGTTWRGSAQTTGASGGWYGNGNISFLGSGSASNGNATWLLQNKTGATITNFILSFTAKLWKSGTANPSVTVSWAKSSSSTNPAQGALANSLSSLTFNEATSGVSSGTTISQAVTGANIGIDEYIFIRFIHAGGSNSDNLGWDDVTFSHEPISASSISFGAVQPTSMTINWVRGNGAGSSVYVKESSQGTIVNPSDGTVYASSTNWSSKEDQLGASGYFCVYNGSGNSVSLTNLTSGTAYYVAVYEYNGSGTAINYKIDTVALGNQATLSAGSDPNVALIGTDPGGAQFTAGTNKNVIYKVQLNVTTASVNLTDVGFATGGNYIAGDIQGAGFRLYYSTDATLDLSDTEKGNLPSSSDGINGDVLIFSGLNQTIDVGSGYLFLTADISSSATALHTLSVSVPAENDFAFDGTYTTAGSNLVAGNVHTLNALSPTLTADVTDNNIDNEIDITFTNIPAWLSASPIVKVNDTTLTVVTDYDLSAGHLILKPGGGRACLRTASVKTVKVSATGYADALVEQTMNVGVVNLTTSTAAISSPLALNTERTVTVTSKDQYNNLVMGYVFTYDVTITNNDGTTAEIYTINEIERTASVADLVLGATNASGVATFKIKIPNTVDANDGVSVQVQLTDGTTNIGSAFSFGNQPTITIIGTDPGSGNFIVSSSENILYRYQIAVTSASVTLNQLIATLAGTYQAVDLGTASLKLFYSANATLDGADPQIGTNVSSVSAGLGEDISFTGIGKVLPIGTSYIFLTTDINYDATLARTISGSSDNIADFTIAESFTTGTHNFAAANSHTIVAIPGAPTDLIISEYVEGSSNNKYIEIYNGTGADINLANYALRLYANGGGTITNSAGLTGTLASGAAQVYKNSSAALTLPIGVTALSNTAMNFNGDDAVVLYRIDTDTDIDIFGNTSSDPGTAWTVNGNTTLDKTLRRKSNITQGVTTNPVSSFPTLGTEWDMFNIDIVSGLGSHSISAFTSTYTQTVTTGSSNYNFLNTGLRINFVDVTTGANISVTRYEGSPIGTTGITESNVSNFRWVIEGNGVVFGNGTSLRFKASSLTGIENPATKTIVLYKRSTPGSGDFTAVGTLTYDAATDEFFVAGITGFSEFVMASDDAPLPVELTSFTARAAGSVVNLNWETKTEVDNNGFDVERNSTGTWHKIGFVEGHGTANSPKYYNFTDKSVTGNKIQYRLRQVDNDGAFEYSNVVEVELAPTTFALDQNYPNPFNPATMIRFSLPTASVVTLNVYNTLGEKVATLLDGAMESGYHQVSFDAANLPSGLYLYEIKAGEFSSIKKMLLMK